MEEPLTMNDDALDAALALLASLDDEDSLNTLLVSTDISDTSTDGSSSEKKPQRSAKSKMSSTTRQREEIERLQGEITELKQLRVRLKSRHARFKVVGLWAAVPTTAAIARRQRRFRERAEEANAALRVRIEEQFHTGRDVFSLLMADMGEQVPRLRFSDDLTSPESMAHLEHLYNCRHAAFSDSCFADTSASFRLVQIVGSNESQTTIVGRDTWTSPFPAHKLDQAFWDMMCQRLSWEGIESVLSPRETPFGEVKTPRYSIKSQDNPVAVFLADDSKPTKKEDALSEGDPKTPSISFFALYRYATPLDMVMLTIAILSAAINGAVFPLMAIFFGNAISGFQTADGGVDRDAVNSAALSYLYLAIALFITDYIAYVLFALTAERQMQRLRGAALKHMLHLNIGWYDTRDVFQLSSRLTGDTIKIKDGMGYKLGEAVKMTCSFVAGYVIGFSKSWKMALVMSCCMPITVLSLAYFMNMLRTRAEVSQQKYAEAGAVAEETLGSIRTVASLNGEHRAIGKYNVRVADAVKENLHLAKYSSIAIGIFAASIWLMNASGLWYGGSRVVAAEISPSEVFQSFYGVMMGGTSLGQISPNLNVVMEALGAAAAIFEILDTPSEIDAAIGEGSVPESCQGRIEARNIHFAYPSRPDAPILNNYNVTIEAGQTVAFVGSSGGGKSTLIALLERFYDPQAGEVLLDGQDIRTLNLAWLRSQIGLVSQEPVLFAGTIYENIAYGGNDISREQAIEAAKMANAHTFIMSLPQQYDTLVGEKGVSLSGGQKQRVAIARAVVRNPKILVLDEATSALDNESERVVQAALDDLMDKTMMTTIVIAHRLSTIRRADKIVVLSGGRVVEEGKHNELLAIPSGVYRGLYTVQEENAKKEAEAVAAQLVDEEDDTPADRNSLRQRTLSQRSSKSSVFNSVYDGEEDVDEGAYPTKRASIWDIFEFGRPERKVLVIGAFAACVCGAILPGSAILISQIVASMAAQYGKYLANEDRSFLDDLSGDIAIYGVCYLAGAVVRFFFTTTQGYCFRYLAEKLTFRLRDVHFRSLCRQNIAFFDEQKHATGALTADLSTNATKVANVSGESLGRVVQAVSTLAVAVVIAFVTGSWELTLVMFAIFPLLIFGEHIQMKALHDADGLSDELNDVGALASESLSNIRTVVALGMEYSLSTKFERLLEVPVRNGRKEAQINGLSVGFSIFIFFAAYALAFWYGGILVEKGNITFVELMRSLMAIMMSSQSAGNAATYIGDAAHAIKSATSILAIRDRPLPIDSFNQDGDKPQSVQGKIEFNDITFRYPTRPNVTVLKRYNLTIEPGQTVAFCGPSGGGKSTCISMLERFYDPVEGQVLLDGRDLKTLNVQWLRRQIGLVGQEPTLFVGTIAENIAYGMDTTPTQEEIEAAAKMANAHDFITHFPDGYNTQVGAKGEQLSGGQKQRIAIARVILKNPSILLLDEATSALDTESEKVVQEALDKIVTLQRRTTIIIAHRLSTIRKADKICVVSGGRIAEQGTHTELLAKNGIYKRLVESAAN
ncbi:hypothetical protein Poli38472_010828 [Pythium oligandrum]|uniref:Uncharacterized protein n=1 Tax=Pythium oligandrum TaxID=41045 RepID=A0A8K1CEK7_PYTOL|nr:hypothetical protein Poli38472_010828 [Pythium oligandrum]|eukprot:TMW61765.1 hypothetical protein Poli38472_010828 [Pythium oligandrum]